RRAGRTWQQRPLHEHGRLAVAAGEPDLDPPEGTRRSARHADGDAAEQHHDPVAAPDSGPGVRVGRLQLVAEAVMRGLRSTILLVVVLAGLGGYVYFVTWKLPEGGADASATKKEKVFAGVEAAKIEEVKLSSAAGDSTTVKKDASGWQLTAPLAAKADESELSSITSALTSADMVRVVDENPTDLNAYGLLNPRIQIDFKAAGDQDYRKLLVGE